jgi:poly-gamma-glutamate capsule biosynthesis protein CapA/YwtB (metallophosphatase superfamily)
MPSNGILTVHAVGDVSPIRKDPDSIFALSATTLRKADVVFCHLERVLSSREDMAFNQALTYPETGRAMADAGFTVASVAGNRHLDAGVGAFLDTLDVLKQNRILPVGVGRNIAEARAPAIVERNSTRVAFLGYSSILPRAEVPYDAQQARPGCAPMYISTYYEATDWQPGTPPRVVTMANKQDLGAMIDDIRAAKAQADIVVMSIHWGLHYVPSLIPMYEYEVGHAAVDAGADLVLGHHAHILKGVEVYAGKVIFHCLGNFAVDRPSKTKKGTGGRWQGLAARAFEPGWDGYPYPPDFRKSMIAKAVIKDKKIERVSFLPCMINQQAQPEPLLRSDRRNDEVYEYVRWCTKDQKLSTEFERDGDEVVVVSGQ